MVNYRYMSGIVGQYQGQDVFIVQEKDFDLARSKGDSRVLFAVFSPGKRMARLISGGMWIGEMSPEGEVNLFKASKFYEETDVSPEKKESKKEESKAKKEEEVKESIFASGKSIDDYLAGETLVDRFLRGLEF